MWQGFFPVPCQFIWRVFLDMPRRNEDQNDKKNYDSNTTDVHRHHPLSLVSAAGFEPAIPCVQGRRDGHFPTH